MFSVETKLAVAAAFNGTMLNAVSVSRENLRSIVLMNMRDYFHKTPVESSQFNADKVLAELAAAPDDEKGYDALLALLGEIGYRIAPAYESCMEDRNYDIEDLLWHNFIEKAVEQWNQEKSVPCSN